MMDKLSDEQLSEMSKKMGFEVTREMMAAGKNMGVVCVWGGKGGRGKGARIKDVCSNGGGGHSMWVLGGLEQH